MKVNLNRKTQQVPEYLKAREDRAMPKTHSTILVVAAFVWAVVASFTGSRFVFNKLEMKEPQKGERVGSFYLPQMFM